MLTVSDDPESVESALLLGRMKCPGCGNRLRPWGWARHRTIRDGDTTDWSAVRFRPRRARCAQCQSTHVLLDVRLAARRADTAAVIGAAVEAMVLGWGYRRIAAANGRPVTTVRDWLRAFKASAIVIADWFAGLLTRDGADAAALWPRPAGTTAGEALSAVMAYAAGVVRRFIPVVTVTWIHVGITATAGRLFCRAWWTGGCNTSSLLWPGAFGVIVAGAPVTPS